MTFTEMEREMRRRGDKGSICKAFSLMRAAAEFADEPVDWSSEAPDWAREAAGV